MSMIPVMKKESVTQSQNASILAHLQAGNTITQIEAYQAFGCTRLSARIYDLRKQIEESGNSIISVHVSFKARTGKVGYYARYYFKPALTDTK